MAPDAPPTAPMSRERRFVAWVEQRCAEDTGFAAVLKRADNPATQPRSWPALAAFGVDLEEASQREAYALAAAHMARRKPRPGPALPLGSALLASCDHQSTSPAGSARMRRLLSVSDVEEACRVLRPMLALIAARDVQLDVGALLEDLMGLGRHPLRVKARWAQGFYGVQPEGSDAGGPAPRSSKKTPSSSPSTQVQP